MVRSNINARVRGLIVHPPIEYADRAVRFGASQERIDHLRRERDASLASQKKRGKRPVMPIPQTQTESLAEAEAKARKRMIEIQASL